jgi:hypothetical protein
MKQKQDFQHIMPSPRRTIKHGSLFGKGRMETGMIQFEGDWPGLFLRGDDAIDLMASVRAVLDLAAKCLPPDRLVEIATYLNRLLAIADLIGQGCRREAVTEKAARPREVGRVEAQGGLNYEALNECSST